MIVSTAEFVARTSEFVKLAALGEEICISKQGVIKARLVPPEHIALHGYFDPQKQARAMGNVARIRRRLAKKGKYFTREEIKAAVEFGRR